MTNDYNTQIIEEFRANDGRVSGRWEGTPLILVHHVGAKSRIERVTPLGCFPQGDGRFVVVASNGGSPTHPAWYHNLIANPVVTVELGGDTFRARATVAPEPERTRLFDQHAASRPNFLDFQSKTTRQLPVIILERIS